jgi:hypothetical protein
MTATPRVDAAVQRLKSVFLEAPATELTLSDACRMTGLDCPICRQILQAFEDLHFLRQRTDGVFIAAQLERFA